MPLWPALESLRFVPVPPLRFNTAAEYRQEAARICTTAQQTSLKESKTQFLDAAQNMEMWATEEERRVGATKPA